MTKPKLLFKIITFTAVLVITLFAPKSAFALDAKVFTSHEAVSSQLSATRTGIDAFGNDSYSGINRCRSSSLRLSVDEQKKCRQLLQDEKELLAMDRSWALHENNNTNEAEINQTIKDIQDSFFDQNRPGGAYDGGSAQAAQARAAILRLTSQKNIDKNPELAERQAATANNINTGNLDVTASVPDKKWEACTWYETFTSIRCLWQLLLMLLNGIAMGLVWVLSWLLFVINAIFGWILKITVREFGSWLNNPGLKAVWSLARDLANVSLLFFLLYAALGMILDLRNIDGKRIVSNVIVVALLVNFSFFFTGVIIKASNTVADFLYTQANTGGSTFMGSPDISTKIISGFMPSFGGKPPAEPPEGYTLDYTFGGILGNFLSTIALILITSIALGAGVVMFFVRFIKLLIYAAISPLAFIGFTVPKLKTYSDKWLSGLIDMCLFPIFFLIFILLASEIASSTTSIWTAKDDWIFGSGFINSLVIGVIINGILVAGLMAASGMGAAGAKWATGKLSGIGKGLSGWARGKLGQNTLGRLGYAANRALSGGKGQAWVGKNPRVGFMLKSFSEKVAKSGYGQKGGSYQKMVEEKAKRVTQFDKPEDQAEYLRRVGQPTNIQTPVIGGVVNRVSKLFGGNADAQQAAFEKLKDQDKARVAPLIDVRPGETVRVAEQEAELDKQVKDQEKERDKQVLTMQTDIDNLKKTIEQEKAKPQTPEIVERVKELEEKLTTSESGLSQIKQEWESKVNKAKVDVATAKSQLGPKTLFQTLRDRMTDKQRGDMSKAEEKKKRDDDEKKIKQKMDLKIALTDDERKRWQEIRKKKKEEKEEEDKKTKKRLDDLENKGKEGSEEKEGSTVSGEAKK